MVGLRGLKLRSAIIGDWQEFATFAKTTQIAQLRVAAIQRVLE
jgi:hypothetical protein